MSFSAASRLRYLGVAVALPLAVISALLLGKEVARRRAPAAPPCTGAESVDLGCFAVRYEALTRVSGVEAALSDLADRQATNGYLGAACHQLAHVVGRTAGQIQGGAAFGRGSDLCASGYFHGVIESVMMSIGAEHIVEQAQSVCAEQRDAGLHSYPHYNCVHGMGHGFMAVFGSDIFQSLAGCDALAESWEQHHCYGGVFMENLTAITHDSRPSKYLKAAEPLYPCTAVAARYKEECYVKQTAYALYVRNQDFAAVFGLCRDAADPDFRATCYEGLGGDATIMSSKYIIGMTEQAANVRKLCLLGPDDAARSNCVAGAVTTIVRDLAGDDRQARALCEVLDPHLGGVCAATLESANREVPTGRSAHLH